MKKYKLGRALESVREDFRVGKHGAEWSVYVSPLLHVSSTFRFLSFALSSLPALRLVRVSNGGNMPTGHVRATLQSV